MNFPAAFQGLPAGGLYSHRKSLPFLSYTFFTKIARDTGGKNADLHRQAGSGPLGGKKPGATNPTPQPTVPPPRINALMERWREVSSG